MSQTPCKYLLRNYRRRRNIACKCFISKSGIEFTFSIFHDVKRMFAEVLQNVSIFSMKVLMLLKFSGSLI